MVPPAASLAKASAGNCDLLWWLRSLSIAARTLTDDPIPREMNVRRVVLALVRALRCRRCAAVSDVARVVTASGQGHRQVAKKEECENQR